ncbi:MAG: peptide deformylase [Bdellovibrionales bacterium]|nr:peptide deformylase [Bdellovibrionales bacterium]
MAVLPILTFPDPRLERKCAPVTEFGDPLRAECQNMLDTMYDAPGIGLAAPQVNIHKNIVVIDIEYEMSEDNPPQLTGKNPLIFVNPRIVRKEGEQLYKEGCLSVPGTYEEVERAARVTLEYQDTDGQAHTLEADGLLAVAIQHELDHLDGRLFIDRLSFVKRKSVKRRILREMGGGAAGDEEP